MIASRDDIVAALKHASGAGAKFRRLQTIAREIVRGLPLWEDPRRIAFASRYELHSCTDGDERAIVKGRVIWYRAYHDRETSESRLNVFFGTGLAKLIELGEPATNTDVIVLGGLIGLPIDVPPVIALEHQRWMPRWYIEEHYRMRRSSGASGTLRLVVSR
jgi:hypothetical protein